MTIMPNRHPIVALLALAALLSLSAAPAAATACKLACKKEACSVKPAAKQPTPNRWTSFDNCEAITVESGLLELGYLHKGRWLRPAALGTDPQTSIKKLFEAKPPDQPCAIISSDCVEQQAMNKTAAVGGHGIDSRAAMPAGEGHPCAIGLPCGAVLASEQARELRLTRPELQGQLSLRIARGQAKPPFQAQLDLPVSKGRSLLPANALQPGSVYEYSFVDGNGKRVARGEFSTLAGKASQQLRQLTQQRAAQGQDEDLAWYDSLVANDLWWDALQLELASQP
jgi:hypothetical protein